MKEDLTHSPVSKVEDGLTQEFLTTLKAQSVPTDVVLSLKPSLITTDIHVFDSINVDLNLLTLNSIVEVGK